ncbi:reprolysin-like metallopeptidase [Flavobacterium pallidum]|nr:zinc-dependent metalloprotease family protein [Flavobacterium pallidum]
MKKTTLLAIFASILFAPLCFAQSINNWQFKKESDLPKSTRSLKRDIVPARYQVFHLDINVFRETLHEAVVRDENNHLSHTVLLSFPFEDGRTEMFSIEKVDVLAPDLGAKYPEIQSYRGVSVDNPLNVIHFSMYNNEFRGLITGERTIYIDPYAKNEFENYIVYDRSDFVRSADEVMICNSIDEKMDKMDPVPSTHRNSTDAKYRTYDLAVACTSEYSAYYGNTISGVLAAVNTTITRVNSVYERDLAVHFQLVSGEDRLIYINNVNKDTPTADPDPYDNYDGSQMLSTNTSNITGLLGVNAYDVGHVFSTGGGGIASTAPCNATGKGQGVTGIVTPQFDPFDIDYVCHEMGHQFGAGHTQNNTCQYSATSGLEPGSASTIMGYAGICPPNVQNNSDAYFHAISIQQITTQIAGHTCDLETTIVNNEPVITAFGNYTIPISTPFVLTGNATDSAADLLTMTYCWEQMDATTTGLAQTPQSTNTTRPQFRSFFPTTSPSRTFPNLNAIINNTTPTWEVLPSVARTMKFRCTVRDNNPVGGQTNQDNTTITVGSAGPFSVTSPNAAATWYVGESKTVTWNVNSTNTATYSVNVNIKMSTDGGLTYPITLLAATPNDGTQAITVPNNIGTKNRIKVEAAANIFFDISNADFEIKSNKFDLTTTQATVPVCKPASAVYTLNYAPAPGFSEVTTFSATNLPSGAIVNFSPATMSASGTVTMTVSGMSSVAIGNYSINAVGTSASANITLPLTLKVFDSAIGSVALSSPVNGATNQATSVNLQWGALANASSYTVEIAANPNFSTLLETATVTTNSYQTTALTTGTINYWRVKPINACITGAYSPISVFQIASDYCHTYTNEYYDGNNVWETNSTNAVIAKMDVPDDVVISKVSFYMKATHASLADIKMQFSGPTGIFVEVYNRDCSGANFDITFDDAGVPLTCGNIDPLTTAGMEGIQQASQPLAKFIGSHSLGTWTLLATDRGANASGGTFNDLNVTICGKLQIVNNISLSNNFLNVTQGTTATLLSSNLTASQPSATNTDLIYTITELPVRGTLKKNGVNLAVGDTFTQANINSGLITYVHNGVNNSADSFKFSLTGVNLALLGAQTFNFNICNVTNTASQVNVLCFGASTGSATVVASGGTAPYTYLWSPSGGTGATASNLAAGTYTCTITDATTCTKSQVFTITQPTAAISNTVSQTNVLCFGSATGSATVVASGGTGAYTYLWSPSGGTGATASNLAAGNYSVRITDANGCFKDQAFTITQPTAPISNTVSQVNVLCFGSATGSATVVASGGTGTYTYLWSPSGGTAATASNLAAGNYSVRITDANGCFKDQAFTITQPTAAISNTVSQVNVLCFGSATGSATVVASGGTGAYTYLWSPSGGTAATASNLAAGNYSVRITDANGCFKDQAFTITQPAAAISNTVSQVNVLCFGSATGSATVVASGGTGAYTYLWSPSGGTAATASNLAAGNYSVRITDANGCFKDQAFTISQPAAAISNTVSQTNVLCFGSATGSASVVASGGTGAYTYLWSPFGGTAATASNLAAGNYSVRITDANGCFKDQAFTITQPTAAISNTVSQTNVLCFGSATGSATVVASGGTGAYTYLWSPSGGTAATASNLAAGNYSVRITDANGCFKDQAFTITQPTAPISNTVSQVNVLCFGSATGSATVVASGGTGAYTYLWSPSGGTAATASNLAAGNYSVRITDANGCFKDQAFTITQPAAAISNTVSQTNVLCFGSATGSASVVASGGTGAYTYLWSPSGGTAATASNLAAGNYSVRITDANGCFKDQAFTITQPAAAISNTVSQVNVLCFGSATGSASVVASGGTGAYTYLWSPSGGTAATASNLAAGNYSVRITDANGCFKDQAFTISQPAAAISNTVSQVNVLCFGSATGSATVVASGGTGAYTYLWSPSGGTAATASNLAAGNYSVRITDANGCFKDQAFTISQPAAAISNTVSQVNVLCFGSPTGSATVVASGGTGAYTYLWSPSGGTAATASNLAAGNYSVRITDANGCFKDQAFTITQPAAAISNTVSQTNVLCFGSATGSASVVASGGTGAYTYLWSPSGGTAATASNLAAGNYSVRITDANGCFKNQAFTITQPTAAISNTVSQTNVLCFGSATGSATVVASGGTGAYTYLWSPSGGTAATASNLAAGNYSVRITDANGCFKDQAFTISQPAVLNNTFSQASISCYGQTDATATVVPSGGTAPYTYSWSPSGGNAATATNLAPGNYTCTITDAHGCSKTQNFTIAAPIITTWNGTSWSNGYPVAGVKAVINANYTSVGDLTACALEINGAIDVNVLSGHDFIIADKVTVSPLSTLTFRNNANLIQINDVVNTGSIISKRNAQMRRQDYVYWSSPVYPQNLLSFSPLTLTNRFYILDETTNSFAAVNPATTDFAVAKGYMIRAPNTFPTTVTTFNGQFLGVPNNGTKTIPVTVTNGQGYNLIGNPYPSTVDADQFLAANSGTLYFWTHTSQDAENGANYATYNTTGGVASIAGGATPNGTIQTGQGFILAKSTPGTATFTNAMRTGNNTGQFFRTGPVEKHRMWLNLNSSSGPANQILVAYMDGATQAKDESIDGALIENGNSISSIINNESFVIQGRALPFEDTDVVPLNFHAETPGTYTLSIDHVDGIFSGTQDIFIKDNLIGLTHNITQSAYSFDTNEGTFANRFEIVYQSAPLGTDNPVFDENNVVIYKHDGILNVKTSMLPMSSVKIFDIRGRLIYEKTDINSNMIELNDLRAEKQVLLVQVISENNITITKKVVY